MCVCVCVCVCLSLSLSIYLYFAYNVLCLIRGQGADPIKYAPALTVGIYAQDRSQATNIGMAGSGVNYLAVGKTTFTHIKRYSESQVRPDIIDWASVTTLQNIGLQQPSMFNDKSVQADSSQPYYTPADFYIIPKSMTENLNTESQIYTPLDAIAAIGGMLSLLTSMLLTLWIGKGVYDAEGMISKYDLVEKFKTYSVKIKDKFKSSKSSFSVQAPGKENSTLLPQ